MTTKKPEIWSIDSGGAFRCRGRLYLPDKEQLRKDILDEADKSQRIVHLGGIKMYKYLKRNFW